ncbi:MAG: glycosyltransferase family 2 protein [Lachnospiraceae bacterium]|nr:glycosyltransferase family 2 protein [Lachnospiraceae bacterium]
MIKLSILVTFYNQEEFVDRAMTNIFNQEVNFKYEVVVGDDGSTDGTVKKIEKWKERYPEQIVMIVQPRVTGKKYLSGERASANRLSLLEHVRGEYFMYLDGDDCYCDDYKLQKQVDILDDPRNVDCGCCAHNVSYVHLDGKKEILKSGFKKSGKISFSKYWWKGYFHPDSFMFRSSSIKQDVDCYKNPLFNDNYITYVFAHIGKVYFLDDIMASYFEVDNGIWRGSSRTVGLMRTLIIYEYLGYIYIKNRMVNYLRFVPLYFKLLENSDEFKEQRLIPYFQMAEEFNSQKVARLKNVDTKKITVLKIWYGLIYYVNAILKRLL